jgi:hypothetical protein
MAYASTNFKTKKALKEAVKSGKEISTYNPSGMFPVKLNGSDVIEGPWYPEPHRWYASVLVQDGVIVKVKS